MCDKWDDGFLAQFPGSAWELRSFRRSYVSEDIAEILDLAGEMFTDAGRIYVMRRLTEEGIGPVNYITWRFDYLFQGNQLAFVTRGRLCAYLVMERLWPRVRPYTDIAYQNLREMFDTVILPDGGLLNPRPTSARRSDAASRCSNCSRAPAARICARCCPIPSRRRATTER